jgi:hypothetical protein
MSKEQFLKENQKAGEVYAGLILGQNGEPDYHLFILPGEAEKVTWSKAKEWAKKAGGDLPTRREQRVLFANAKQHFKPEWYWSGEQHASDSGNAWGQAFGYGLQGYDNKSVEGRARAVRRSIRAPPC